MDKKRIVVHVDDVDSSGHFIYSGRKTRKKSSSSSSSSVKNMKKNAPEKKISSTLLNNIRKTYLSKENTSGNSDNMRIPAPVPTGKKSDFQSSLEFINQVVQAAKTSPVDGPIPCNLSKSSQINYHRVMKPSYGCLKQGVLPTYHTLQQLKHNHFPIGHTQIPTPMGHTQIPVGSSLQQPVGHTQIPMGHTQIPTPMGPTQIPVGSSLQQPVGPTQIPTPMGHTQPPVGANVCLEHVLEKQNHHNSTVKKSHYKPNRIRTIRRTFHLGRSSNKPVVSVLLQNDTIRKRIQHQKHSLNGISLNQIKTELIRAGFLKGGSDAPENMLRKMYENMILIGGPVKNFNPDIVAYNLLHHPEVYAN